MTNNILDKFKFAESRKSELIKENNHMQDIKNEEYVTCSRCEKEVYKDAITCPFCNFGIMAWLEGEINEKIGRASCRERVFSSV